MTKPIELAGLLLNDVEDSMTIKEYKEYLKKHAEERDKQNQQEEVNKKNWYAQAEKLGKCFKTVNNPNSITYMHCFPSNSNDSRDYSEVHGETISVYFGYTHSTPYPEKKVSVEVVEGIPNKLWLPNPYEFRYIKCRAEEIPLEEYNRVKETYSKIEKIINNAIKDNENNRTENSTD